MIHGRNAEAERIVDEVEQTISAETLPAHERAADTDPHTHAYALARDLAYASCIEHRRRSFLGFVLMLTQAFFYNAIFFTYGLVLMRFYDVPAQNVGGYLLPFALGNILGPFLIGHLFDTIGRKQMITTTYALSGILLALTGWLFHAGMLTAHTGMPPSLLGITKGAQPLGGTQVVPWKPPCPADDLLPTSSSCWRCPTRWTPTPPPIRT